MSSVRRAGRGETAQHREAVLTEAERASAPEPALPEPALPEEAAALVPPDSSHLIECPQCHVLNGRSAASCWSCESLLFGVDPVDEAKAAEPAAAAAMTKEPSAPGPAAVVSDAPRPGGLHLVTRGGFPTVVSEVVATPDAPAHALPSSDMVLPVLTNLAEADVAGHEAAVEVLPAFARPEPSWQRAFVAERSWPIGRWALIGLAVLVVGFGMYQFRGAPDRDAGNGPTPEATVAPVTRDSAPVPTATPGRDNDRTPTSTGAGALADVPVVNLPRVAAEPVRPRPEPRQKPASTATKPRGKAGAATGAAGEAAVPTAAQASPAAERSPRPAAVTGPCTVTVAALGLCSPPATATKE